MKMTKKKAAMEAVAIADIAVALSAEVKMTPTASWTKVERSWTMAPT